MTNKPMLSVERDLIVSILENAKQGYFSKDHGDTLRRLLDKEVDGDSHAPKNQGESVAWQFYQDGKWWNGDDRIKDHRKNTDDAGYKTRELYAEQPAPVAVMMPEDWEDQLFAEMSRRFDLRKQIDDDHMVYDDTQIGVEFARDWIKARLNEVKP